MSSTAGISSVELALAIPPLQLAPVHAGGAWESITVNDELNPSRCKVSKGNVSEYAPTLKKQRLHELVHTGAI